MKKRVRKQQAQTTFTIRTARGNQEYHCARKSQEISEFRKSLELNDSKEPESIIRVGGWVWVQYVTEGGEVDNNLALAVAILRYKSGSSAVALLWGEITEAGWDGGPQRVVCTDDCQVVDMESIGGGVIEPEKSGRILTENSVGAKFSLDRYHVSSNSHGGLELLESVTFETESGRPSERFLQEVTLAEGSPVDAQSPSQQSLLRGAFKPEQSEGQDGDISKELGLEKHNATTGPPSRPEPPRKSTSKSRTSAVEDGELVAGADVDADENKDSDASVQAESEANAGTDVDEQGIADNTAITKAVAKTDDAVYARSGIATDMEKGVRSESWKIVDVHGTGKTCVNAEPDADEDAVANGEADGKVRAESAADTEADTDTEAVTIFEPETEVETEKKPDAGAETDVHADTEPKSAGNTGSHTQAAAGLGAAPGAESNTATAGVLRTNGGNVGTVCAGERSSARRKRIYNDTSRIDQPPKKAKVAGSPAMSGSGEKTPSKAYLTNNNAIVSLDLRKSQPSSTSDEGPAVEEREKQLLFARHKLQRWFLRETSAPSELEVSAADKLLTSLELRPDSEWVLMNETKIYKALKMRCSTHGKDGEDSTVGRRLHLIRRAWLTLKWRTTVMPAKVRTDTTWEKDREHRLMTQHNSERQAVNLWSIQVLHILDPRVSRGICRDKA